MNFIVLDSEWNCCYYKQKKKHFNELIEIGAVKLDNNLNIVDKFNAVIKSQLTNKLSSRFIDLTNISNEEMLSGKPFSEVIAEFSEWAGKDSVVFTWSNSDIYTLFYNCRDFLGLDYIPGIRYFADAQKIVQNYLREQGFLIESQISLENAAHLMNVSTEEIELHRAIDDSVLTAKLFARAYNRQNMKSYITDTKDKKFYDRISFQPYIINNIKSKYVKKSKMNFNCGKCHKKAKRISDWYFKGSSFRAEFYCKNCDSKFIGNVTFKKNYDKVNVRKYRQEPETVTN